MNLDKNLEFISFVNSFFSTKQAEDKSFSSQDLLKNKSYRENSETTTTVDYKPTPTIKKKNKLFGLVIPINSKNGLINRGKKNKKTVFYHTNKLTPNNITYIETGQEGISKMNKEIEGGAKVNKEKTRGSNFRGVSRNGNQWQVLIMVNKKKRYVASFSNETSAAKAYDKVALQHHGLKAKTNFFYSEDQIKQIMAEPYLLNIIDK